jgi:hypothetical protein
MRNLIILGNDKIAGALSDQIADVSGCTVYIDRSTGVARVWRLLKERRISPTLLLKMFLCEFLRTGARPSLRHPPINSNRELLAVIERHKPERLILFRAGLIINRDVIETGVPIFNIHAAKIPDYGGIGSIAMALSDKAYDQYASLHIVTDRIDQGQLVDRVNYRLEPTSGYCRNEAIAYIAGQQLLLRVIAT